MDRYIDSHNHMHALSWDQWEQFAMTGMAGAILSCGNPHVYREIWEIWGQHIMVSHRVRLSHREDVDDELADWLDDHLYAVEALNKPVALMKRRKRK